MICYVQLLLNKNIQKRKEKKNLKECFLNRKENLKQETGESALQI